MELFGKLKAVKLHYQNVNSLLSWAKRAKTLFKYNFKMHLSNHA